MILFKYLTRWHFIRWVRRFGRKLRNLFSFRSWGWEYESCEDCGTCYRVLWATTNEKWAEVMGDADTPGAFCPTCFIERAEERGVVLSQNDFTFEIFQPYDEWGLYT